VLRWWDFRPITLDYVAVVVIFPIVWILLFRSYDLHAPQHLSAWEEFRRTLSASSLCIVNLVMFTF